MSHFEERSEKICLNCNAGLIGRYCHKCGQENREPKETVWHFVNHFVNDFTHFDGKFFTTLKDLLFRPGFLSREYMMGKRERYLNPIRMYLFTSFIFFLIFFSVVKFDEPSLKLDKTEMDAIKNMPDAEFNKKTAGLSKGKAMSRKEFNAFIDSVFATDAPVIFSNTEEESDSIKQNKGWLDRLVDKKGDQLNNQYKGDKKAMWSDFADGLLHRFPQMLFVSLPLIALILHLLYWRHKEFYYVSHAVFVVHFYIFLFICLLVRMGLSALSDINRLGFLEWIVYALTLAIFFYLYKAMHHFYKQSIGKTLLKYLLFLIITLVLFILISLAFVLWSLAML